LARKGVDATRRIFWFVGLFGRTYDLATVIEAIKSIPGAARSDAQFVFCGDGELGPEWRRLAAGVSEIVFTGWIDSAEIACLGGSAYCGLQAYAPNAPQGLANKLYEYLSFGLPILSSLAGENEALLENSGAGITYRAGDRESCAEAIRHALEHPEWAAETRLRAASVFEQNFEAEAVYARAVRLIERIATGAGERRAPQLHAPRSPAAEAAHPADKPV
jgi:glycosyltransferase involved in cell wall biosynthesis